MFDANASDTTDQKAVVGENDLQEKPSDQVNLIDGSDNVQPLLSPFRNEVSGDSVRALLIGAMISSSAECEGFWWKNVTISSEIQHVTIGRGSKRKNAFTDNVAFRSVKLCVRS